MTIAAQHGHPERDALLNISWSPVAIQPPVDGTALHITQVKASLVRVWEPEPPQGVEALEWILVTSVTVNTTEDAWQRVTWYKWRWFVEDFHKVLKTGCLLEDRCLQTVDAMCNLLAILTPTAMRLLWLRQTAQVAPDTPATEVTPLCHEFSHDDTGYLAWVDTHPHGFVLNQPRAARSKTPIMHRVGCSLVAGRDDALRTLTVTAVKVCGPSAEVLGAWSVARGTGQPAPCRRCLS